MHSGFSPDRIIPWFAWIAITAIVCSSANVLIKNLITHRERMSKLRMGIDPDAPDRKPASDGWDG